MVCSEKTKELQKYLVLSYEYAKTFEAQANKEEGLNGNPGLRDILAGMRILERMRQELFPPKDEFDRIHGKDTSGVTSLRRLRIASPNKAEGASPGGGPGVVSARGANGAGPSEIHVRGSRLR
jgi:hypothetical protein